MRRRPMEFWWIAAFSISQALLAFSSSFDLTLVSRFDRTALAVYASAFLVAPALLILFVSAGRFMCTALLGVECLHQLVLTRNGMVHFSESEPGSVVLVVFCAWMLFYLNRPSTARLFDPRSALRAGSRNGLGFCLIDLMEGVLALATSWIALSLGLPLWAAGGLTVVCYVVYGVLLEDWVHRQWAALFVTTEPHFPQYDAKEWRRACNALANRNFSAASKHIMATSQEAREHRAGRLFLGMLDWYDLLARQPVDGHSSLRRLAYDHDWKPNDVERKHIADCLECSTDDAVRKLIDERAELIDALVEAGANPKSYFYKSADGVLSSITGETFQFNTHESWVVWWDDNREYWSGDAGTVSLVARLLQRDAIHAANALATLAAGRAEEPLLREVTAQVLFLNLMQQAMQERKMRPYINQPRHMLLVPEVADTLGILHLDSPLLENETMPLSQVKRRILLRTPMVDYLAELWKRYPNELNADMPWLLRMFTGKNLGILRGRSKFDSWWPVARESMLRHDRAVCAALTAIANEDNAAAEKAFRAALIENPRELSSRYNLALLLLKRHAYRDAARLIEQLTEIEPKEHYWWMKLGDVFRALDRPEEAYAAFRRALELGASEGQVALQLGLTYGRDKRDAEAIQQFDRVLGKNPSAARIDMLVSTLEKEELWKLAGHYRERAFRLGLVQNDDGDRNDADAVS